MDHFAADPALPTRESDRIVLQSGLPLRFTRSGPHLVSGRYDRPAFRIAKRVLDLTCSLLALGVFAPLLLIIAILVVMDSPGPVLFRQQRWGKDRRVFTLYKFRTMPVTKGDLSGVNQTMEDDDRVSRIGLFLRKSSLDELPQLFNVLLGDMSLVGPRPHALGMLAGGPSLYEELVPYYFERNRALPGLTGWAQVNRLRGPTIDPAIAFGRVDHDLAYIENASILLDLRILLLTVQREFLRGTGF